MPQAKKQQDSRLIAKSNNKIKMKWKTMRKDSGKVHSVELFSTLVVSDKKLKDPTNVASAFTVSL